MCELPPEFPLASPSSGIVHHLSGPTARAVSSERGSARSAFRFRCADGFDAHRLARAMDSLVRVSRRVACDEVSEGRARTPRGGSPGRAGRRERTHVRDVVESGSACAVSGTFHSLSKVLFSFPSRYFFAIGFPLMFNLGWRSPPVGTAISNSSTPTSADWRRPRDPIGSLTRLRQPVPWPFRRRARATSSDADTRQHATHIAFSRLGSALFARRYWGHPVWFLFLRLMICLSSAGFLAGDIV